MKIIEFHLTIMKKMKIYRVRLEKNKNHRNLIISCENQPNLENHRIHFENQKKI